MPKQDKPSLIGKTLGIDPEGHMVPLSKVDELDQRRQEQVQNQIKIINRLQAQVAEYHNENRGARLITYVLLTRLLPEGAKQGKVWVSDEDLRSARAGSVSVEEGQGGFYMNVSTS
jgi:hypothetical protein